MAPSRSSPSSRGLSLAMGALALAASRVRRARRQRRSSCCRRRASSTRAWPSTSHDGIARAERDGAAAVVIKLNTPGGSLDRDERHRGHAARGEGPGHRLGRARGRVRRERRDVHHARREHRPDGARHAASAPRRRSSGQGEDIAGTIGEKVKNDAIAKITAIAAGPPPQRRLGGVDRRATPARHRPARRSRSGAVDGIAPTLEDVLAFANGKEVEVARRAGHARPRPSAPIDGSRR